jgi:hypothetical protein
MTLSFIESSLFTTDELTPQEKQYLSQMATELREELLNQFSNLTRNQETRN